MRKIIVTFGLISGAISSLMMIALVTFGGSARQLQRLVRPQREH
jgi:hypothetical protein